MKIFTAAQIKNLDALTITEQNLQTIELMERAAKAFTGWFTRHYDFRQKVQVLCGIGDNGGDGLAIARLLYERDYDVTVYILNFSNKVTKDFKRNLESLRYRSIKVVHTEVGEPLVGLDSEAVTIDAILGSGLSRPVDGWLAKILTQVNEQIKTVIAVDIASGLFADTHTESVTIFPKQTFCFEVPKLAYFFPENYKRVGDWFVDSIQLSQKSIEATETPYHYITPQMIRETYRPRSKFDHKGTYGRALLIVGSKGMMGAGLLAAKSCIRSGVGLATAHVPQCGYTVAQTAIPELMVSVDANEDNFSEVPNMERYNAVGIGCGIGEAPETQAALKQLLETVKHPLVLDASALNIIAKNNWHQLIPENSIITPHHGEFQRLFGDTSNDFERNDLQRKKAQELKIFIILKGAHSSITCPDGRCFFNSTGNPGMATGGSGDVLTGILTALLAQGYSPLKTALLGVYLHGLAGDLAAEKHGFEAMIAGDIVNYLGKAFAKISLLGG
jgi:ADP-dependent NAD(P)H-hydrate dehydratase / NAD(P)H-hydrate epimerase